MDRPGVWQVPEGNGEQGKIEKIGCKIICGAPTTLAVKKLMMMMMMMMLEVFVEMWYCVNVLLSDFVDCKGLLRPFSSEMSRCMRATKFGLG